MWSALGTHLCGKDGCTKSAWRSGTCVSVLGYRRDQKPVQKYTVEPAPSPRELMSQAREKRRLPPSKRPKLGDRVRGKYQGQIGGRNWFNGVVTTVHEDGTCDLHYDDGDHEERVAPRFIKTIAKEETEELEEPEEVAEPEEPEKVELMVEVEVQVVEEEVEVVEETSERQDAAGASNQQRKLKVLSDSGTGGSGRPRIDEPPALARLIHYGLSSAGSCEMLPDEARAAAAAEGLELVPSSIGETGFKSVTKHVCGKYEVRIQDNRKKCYLGIFATPEEAALCYARHIGAKRAAAEAAAARGKGPQSLTADEARAAAAAEGLELVPSSNSETGFRGVQKHYGKYALRFKEYGVLRYFGSFATPEEAALCYARHIGAERAAAEAAAARGKGPQSLTADEARAAAAAEGLKLVPSSSNETGFKGAHKRGGKYEAYIREDGKQRYLGMFATPEEAALCYARHIGAERAAAEAVEARVAVPEPLTADEARAAAAAEGLELVPSSSNETGFRSVVKHGGKYQAQIKENGKTRHLGSFATPEEAALCYARRLGAERAAAEAALARDEGPQPLTADEARAAAASEGLEMVPSSSIERGFKGVRDLVDGWLIPGRRPSHRPPPRAPVPAPPTPIEVEQAEALRCWRLLLTAMRDDHRSQQGSSSSSALPPPSPAATTMHASRKRPAVAVAFAEVGVPRAEALQPQLTAKSGDDPGAARCVICLEALNLSSASASSRGEAACGHTPCCGNYFHKRCLSQWLQGSRQSGSPLPIEKKCPTCRRDLVARALIPWALPTAPLHECK